jgi:hypothetical protein
MNIPVINVDVSTSSDPQDAQVEAVTTLFMLDSDDEFRERVVVDFIEDLLGQGADLGENKLTLNDLIRQAADDVLTKYVAAHPDRYSEDAANIFRKAEEEDKQFDSYLSFFDVVANH